jgi:uracil-DNA glycosylase family 4
MSEKETPQVLFDAEDSLSTPAAVLHEVYQPTKGRPFGCLGCKVFQYTKAFTEEDRLAYKAKLDPKASEAEQCSYQIGGTGPLNAKIMVVLESPTGIEDGKGKCAIGGGAMKIRQFASTYGLNADKWFWTYAMKCRGIKPPKVADAVYCTKFLAEDIQKVKPDIILAVGSLATALLLGKPKANAIAYHCVPQTITVAGHTCSVYPIWSADYVRRNDHLNKRYLDAFEKFAAFTRGESIVAVDSSEYELVEDVQDAIALCQRILVDRIEQGKTWLDVDLETTGLKPFRKDQRVTTISMAYSTEKGYAIPYAHKDVPWTDEDRKRFVEEGLKPLLTHPEIKLRWVNGKFDYQWFIPYFGFSPRDLYQDAMLAHYSSNENEEHGLKPLALRYTDMGDYDHELDEYLKANFPADDPHYDLVPWPLLGKYAAMDSVASKKIAKTIKQHVAEQNDPAVYALAYKAMPAYSAAITRLEMNGIYVDVDFATKAVPIFETNEARSLDAVLADPIVRRFTRDREQKERNKRKHPEKLPGIETKRYFEFSLNSGKQLSELMFSKDYYGHEVIAYTDAGAPSTDKEVMKALAEQGSPIAKKIEEYRLDSKLLSTFIRPTLEDATLNVHPMRHPNMQLSRAKTGRLTCNDGLHQIPNKGAGLIKRMFVSRYGDDGCIVQADFSQVELRILACLANDKGMIKAFLDGEDPHTLVALMLFDLTMEQFLAIPEKERKEMRTIAKRIGFGIPYGTGAPGICSMLRGEGIHRTEEVCQSYIDKFFLAKPKVKRWIDLVKASTSEESMSKSLFGRRRRLEQVQSIIESVVASAHRQAVNHPIQSCSADITLCAMTLMDEEICLRRGDDVHLLHPTMEHRSFPIDERWKRVHQILSVHDSIVMDCHKDVVADVIRMMQETMPNIPSLAHHIWGQEIEDNLACLKKVPLAVDVEVGPNYRDGVKTKKPEGWEEAYFVACEMRKALDIDYKFKWGDEQTKAAREAWLKHKESQLQASRQLTKSSKPT